MTESGALLVIQISN